MKAGANDFPDQDPTPDESPAESMIGLFSSPEDAAMMERIVYEAYFNRRLGALGQSLLEASERLLDPIAFDTTEKQARRDVQEIVRQIKYGYDDEHAPPKG